MGDQGQSHTADSQTRDTLNTKFVPIVFVPGVMGTRLDIRGAVSDWDPDDMSEMAGWVTSTRRSVAKDISFSTGAKIMRDLDIVLVSNTNPPADIRGHAVLRERAVDNTKPRPSEFELRDPLKLIEVIGNFWRTRGWGEVVWSFYGRLLMELEETLNPLAGSVPHPVYAVGYDWRQSNKDSGARLNRRITEILAENPQAKRVIVVTHSMGGLVTRSAIARGGGATMAGVVHAVIPADGAAVAYRRFLTGARPEHGETEGGLNNILGSNRLSYAVTQRGARGPTELLPSESYPEPFLRMSGGITNKDFPDLYGEYQKQAPPGVVPQVGEKETDAFPDLVITAGDVVALRARLSEARAFTRSIAGVAHPNTFLLFGNRLVTDVEFDWTTGKATPSGKDMTPMVVRKPEGDGTVPQVSGQFRAANALGRDAANVEHAKCFADGGFRAAVVDRIRRLLGRA